VAGSDSDDAVEVYELRCWVQTPTSVGVRELGQCKATRSPCVCSKGTHGVGSKADNVGVDMANDRTLLCSNARAMVDSGGCHRACSDWRYIRAVAGTEYRAQ